MSETVQALVSLQAYQQSRAHLFPSVESIRWYVRRHREELIDGGAVLTVAGRVQVSPGAFDGCLLVLGKRDALRVSA